MKSQIPLRKFANSKMTYGGDTTKGKRKCKRPLIPNKLTHLVLKSSKAHGRLSFFRHSKAIDRFVSQLANKYFIEIKEYVTMSNHLHLKLRFKDPKRFRDFLKALTSSVAKAVTGARKGRPFGQFWDHVAYTHVLISRFEEFGLKIYFQANRLEKEFGYEARETFLKRENDKLRRMRMRVI